MNKNLKEVQIASLDDDQFKIREFEWFDVETKIRQLVTELLKPTFQRIASDRTHIEKISDGLKNNNERLEEIMQIVLRKGQKMPIFEQINESIHNIDVKANLSQQETTQQIRVFQEEIHKMKEKYSLIGEISENFIKMKDNNKKYEYDNQTQTKQFEDQVLQRLEKFNNEILKQQIRFQQDLNKLQDQIYQTEGKIKEKQNQIDYIKKSIDSLSEKVVQVQNQTNENDKKIESNNISQENLINKIQIVKTLAKRSEDTLNKLNTLENYIEKYHPLYVQYQISNVFYNCLNTRSKKRIAEFEEKFLQNYNQELLKDDGIGNIDKKIREFSKFIENMILRNKLLLKNHQIQNSQNSQNNENSDQEELQDEYQNSNNNQFQFNEKNNYNNNNLGVSNIYLDDQSKGKSLNFQTENNLSKEIVQSSDNKQQQLLQQQLQNDQVKQNKESGVQSQVKVYQQQIFLSNENPSKRSSQDSNQRQLTQAKMQQLIKQEVTSILQTFKSFWENRFTEFGKGLAENEEMINQNIIQNQNQLEIMQKQISNLKSDQELEKGILEQKFISMYQEISKIVTTFNKLSETIHKVLHFSTIQNHLAIQDEIDKQGIALFGLKETFAESQKSPNIQDITPQLSQNFYNLQNQSSQKNQNFGINSNNQIPNNMNASNNFQKKQGNNLNLDRNCFSCTGQSAIIYNMFKIACLAYQPSNIIVDGKQFRRDELLELSTKVLQAARSEYGLKANLFQNYDENHEENQIKKNINIDQMHLQELNKTHHVNNIQSNNPGNNFSVTPKRSLINKMTDGSKSSNNTSFPTVGDVRNNYQHQKFPHRKTISQDRNSNKKIFNPNQKIDTSYSGYQMQNQNNF